jgi:hypothetical protein
MASKALLLPATAATGIIAWRSAKQKKRPPLPSELFAVMGVFGILSIAGDNETWSKVAQLTGWGLVIAMMMNVAPSIFGNTVTANSAGQFVNKQGAAGPTTGGLPPTKPFGPGLK